MSARSRFHRLAHRTGLEILGWTLVVLGFAALVLPGPGLLMLVAGLAVLSQQYAWAERRLHPVKEKAFQAAKIGVKTWPRIVVSCLSALAFMTVGIVWMIGPPVPGWWPPEPGWWLANLNWWLPGGWGTGLSLVLSAIIALVLIVYSVRRFR
ncbi:PGPGW domain-containing protein, partial [Arthrobacter sp. H5]|uniref:PGPGW domain-containing protein n=1 Tax=Arthrobacter sp. H5 TaxID=1267973 RepID=UPI00056CE09E